ncbi:hypothetical protein HDU93_002851 [Gonapodya sp. JEL0774]|nr:hypothetical protein HDU93_002851 [Gonapodya sp. JEL0774]
MFALAAGFWLKSPWGTFEMFRRFLALAKSMVTDAIDSEPTLENLVALHHLAIAMLISPSSYLQSADGYLAAAVAMAKSLKLEEMCQSHAGVNPIPGSISWIALQQMLQILWGVVSVDRTLALVFNRTLYLEIKLETLPKLTDEIWTSAHFSINHPGQSSFLAHMELSNIAAGIDGGRRSTGDSIPLRAVNREEPSTVRSPPDDTELSMVADKCWMICRLLEYRSGNPGMFGDIPELHLGDLAVSENGEIVANGTKTSTHLSQAKCVEICNGVKMDWVDMGLPTNGHAVFYSALELLQIHQENRRVPSLESMVSAAIEGLEGFGNRFSYAKNLAVHLRSALVNALLGRMIDFKSLPVDI